eukprot:9319668-Pyramimonas_sp.AAC.1
MAAISPKSQHRSLAILSLLEGGPPWGASVAPIIRWCKELWLVQTRAFDGALPFSVLRAAWGVAFDRGDWSWANVG